MALSAYAHFLTQQMHKLDELKANVDVKIEAISTINHLANK